MPSIPCRDSPRMRPSPCSRSGVLRWAVRAAVVRDRNVTSLTRLGLSGCPCSVPCDEARGDQTRGRSGTAWFETDGTSPSACADWLCPRLHQMSTVRQATPSATTAITAPKSFPLIPPSGDWSRRSPRGPRRVTFEAGYPASPRRSCEVRLCFPQQSEQRCARRSRPARGPLDNDRPWPRPDREAERHLCRRHMKT